jgi:hypothetical protein
MTSLKINTIEADTTTTFSQVPSISATVSAYPSVGLTIPTTTWVQNTINTLLTPFALLSSANFTALSRGSKQVLATTRPENVFCQFGTGAVTTSGVTLVVTFPIPFTTCIYVQTQITIGNTVIRVPSFNSTTFSAFSGTPTATFDWIAWGY